MSGRAVGEQVRDLEAETAYLAARLGQPTVRTRGATGVLHPFSRTSVWVHDAALDLPALLEELTGRLLPDLLLRPDACPDVDLLLRTGWTPTPPCLSVRRDVPLGAGAPDPVLLSGTQLRAARAVDLPEVRSLHATGFDGDPEEYLPDDALAVPGLEVLLARDRRGAPAGTVGVRLRHRGVLLFALAVRPDLRGRGLGAGLVAAALRWAWERDRDLVVAEVEPARQPFWTSAGFRPDGRWQRWLPPR